MKKDTLNRIATGIAIGFAITLSPTFPAREGILGYTAYLAVFAVVVLVMQPTLALLLRKLSGEP